MLRRSTGTHGILDAVKGGRQLGAAPYFFQNALEEGAQIVLLPSNELKYGAAVEID